MEGQVVPGAAAAEVRAILGDPWRVEAEGAEESWVYRERWADGVDRGGQVVLGFLTLGIYWFLPPEAEHHEVIFQDGRAAAMIRFGSSSPDGEAAGKSTLVTTDPPGARIEVDGSFMAHSPILLVWKAPAHGGRYFADRPHVIAARLETASQTLQEHRIPGGKFLFEWDDRIPPEVHFDLKSPPEGAR